MKPASPSTFLLVVAVLLRPGLARAEESPPGVPPATPPGTTHPWSVSLGTGGGSFVEFAEAFSTGGPAGSDSSSRQGRLQVNARLERQLEGGYLVGLAWTYLRWTETYFSGATQVGSIDNSVNSLMASLSYRWYRTEHVELVSGVAAGAGRWSRAGDGTAAPKTGVESGFAFQLRAIGISAGNEWVRAFAELGLGFEGLLIGGVNVRF